MPTWLKSVAAEAQEVMAAAARAENAVSLIQRNECIFITEKGAFFSIWGKSWRRDVSVTDLQVIVYLIKRPHDAILLSLFPEGDKSKWKPVHPEISGGGRGRKEENSWVDKSTIKFEILCGSPAFVILELHGNGFHFTDVFSAFLPLFVVACFLWFSVAASFPEREKWRDDCFPVCSGEGEDGENGRFPKRRRRRGSISGLRLQRFSVHFA